MWKSVCIYLCLPLFSSVLLFLYFTFSTPTSTVLTNNVDSPVYINRDDLNIPHIYADSLKDAIYALGYSMCQDRMWQIDIMRRLSTGRASETLGKSALELDKFIRNLKVPRLAASDVKNLSNKTIQIVESFVQGINDAANSNWLPIEYYITNTKWENFTIADSQSNIYFTGLFLSNIWGSDVLKVQFRKALGKVTEFLMPYDNFVIRPKAFSIENSELTEELKGPKERLKSSDFEGLEGFYTQIFDEGAGSNGWVISGKHTKSGKPIMSNDPHLSSSIPSLWYMSQITVGNYSQYGGSLIGIPLISIGRNNEFVWGTTSLKVDDIDIYAEKPLNSSHYQFGNDSLKFEYFQETIKIKGESPVTINFRETVHGPIIENSIVGIKKMIPAFSGLPSNTISIAWASLGGKDQSLELIEKIMELKSIEEYRKEFSKTTAIRLSFFGASKKGDIFYQAIGRVPIRRYKGDSVLPGWLPETMWKGFVPADEMPYSINPEKGFIVTANNYMVNEDYKYFESLGGYFSQGRAERITEILQGFIDSGHKFTAEDQVEIMKDELDIFARRSVPTLLKMVKNCTKYPDQLKKMQNWDFLMSVNSNLPGIYAKWSIQIIKNLLKNRISPQLLQFYLRNQVMHNNFYLFFTDLYSEIQPLCDNPNTVEKEDCEDLVTLSFDEAAEFVGEHLWGDLHAVVLKHLPFSQVPYLKWFYERKVPLGGWMNTIHASYSDWNSTFTANQGPGFKFVCDLGNSSGHFWSLETGISGNMLSKHYDDMLKNIYYEELPRFNYI